MANVKRVDAGDPDIAWLDATTLLRCYRARTLSPVEVARVALARIERVNPHLNAFCFLDPDTTLAAARESEARWFRGEPVGRVDGVPVTVKDAILTRGWPTRRASMTISAAGPWLEDAPCVARLREEGAVLLGKTTASEFSHKSVTNSPLYGITRNPWNPALTPGGSSGGAAVAAALGLGALHIGGDGGGSVRNPAAFCGVIGLKPDNMRIPFYPHSGPGTIGAIGPLARSVADLALALAVMARPDRRDWWAMPPTPVALDAAAGSIRGLRIAYSRNLGYARVEPGIERLVAAAVADLGALGAVVAEADPGFANPFEAFQTMSIARYGAMIGRLPPAERALVDPSLIQWWERSQRLTAADLVAAENARAALGQKMAAFHRRFDLLVTPQLPVPAFEADRDWPESRGYAAGEDWKVFSYPFNWSQQPALSVPVGLTSEGLPVSMQIVGPRYREDLVLCAAAAYGDGRPSLRPPAL